jgi:gluconate 5-dehydrogenase
MSVLDSFRLDGKTAIITGGGTGGLGRWMAEALLEAGARVVVTSRTDDKAQQASEVGSDRLAYTAADVRDPASVERLFDFTAKRFGPADILVNNAGTAWGEPTETIKFENWQRVVDVNVNGTFLMTQRFGQAAIADRRKGKIVNIASVAGLRGGMNHNIAYSTTKAAVINFTRAMAVEWGPFGINVNAIAPGLFPTKLSKGIIHEDSAARIPIGRLGQPEDIKGLVLFLTSPASDYVTGAVITLDGGSSA